MVEDVVEGGMVIMLMIGWVCLLWFWGGIMDMLMDGLFIIDKIGIDGFYFNGGWCYGGFKVVFVVGVCFVYLLVIDILYEIVIEYWLDWFNCGYVIDEKGVGV